MCRQHCLFLLLPESGDDGAELRFSSSCSLQRQLGRTIGGKIPKTELPQGIVSSNGRIEADEIDVATKFAGRVAELRVDEGDMVNAGEVVARMDARPRTSLKRAEARPSAGATRASMKRARRKTSSGRKSRWRSNNSIVPAI